MIKGLRQFVRGLNRTHKRRFLEGVARAIECGGEGGKPGPCATGGGDKDAAPAKAASGIVPGDHKKTVEHLQSLSNLATKPEVRAKMFGKGGEQGTALAKELEPLQHLPPAELVKVVRGMGFKDIPKSRGELIKKIHTSIHGRWGAFDRVGA